MKLTAKSTIVSRASTPMRKEFLDFTGVPHNFGPLQLTAPAGKELNKLYRFQGFSEQDQMVNHRDLKWVAPFISQVQEIERILKLPKLACATLLLAKPSPGYLGDPTYKTSGLNLDWAELPPRSYFWTSERVIEFLPVTSPLSFKGQTLLEKMRASGVTQAIWRAPANQLFLADAYLLYRVLPPIPGSIAVKLTFSQY